MTPDPAGRNDDDAPTPIPCGGYRGVLTGGAGGCQISIRRVFLTARAEIPCRDDDLPPYVLPAEKSNESEPSPIMRKGAKWRGESICGVHEYDAGFCPDINACNTFPLYEQVYAIRIPGILCVDQ